MNNRVTPQSCAAALPAASLSGAVVPWVLIQLAVIAVAGFGVNLSAHYARPAESAALSLLICTQVVAACVLFPLLAADWRRALATWACSLPFLQLAGALAAERQGRICLDALYLGACLMALWAWSVALTGARARLTASAVAGGLAIAGPLLAYLQADYSLAGNSSHFLVHPFGPTMGALALSADRFEWRLWGFVVVGGAIGAAWPLARRLSRQVIHRSSTEIRE